MSSIAFVLVIQHSFIIPIALMSYDKRGKLGLSLIWTEAINTFNQSFQILPFYSDTTLSGRVPMCSGRL